MAKFGEWIEVKWRDLTEEEREYYDNEDITHMADFETPDDGDEILISTHNGKWVDLVTFCNDEYGIGDEKGNDWLDEVDAWMPLPKGFVKENDDKGLEQCDKCDYFISVEDAYKQGRADAIEELISKARKYTHIERRNIKFNNGSEWKCTVIGIEHLVYLAKEMGYEEQKK